MKNIKRFSLALLLGLSSLGHAGVNTPISGADCQQDYLSLMNKSEINVTVAYGYFDLGDHTTLDVSLKNYFIQTMTTPCKTWDLKTCGFKKAGNNPIILTRKMTGPDGQIKTVKITVDSPSVSTSDETNRNNPQQKVRSEAVKNMFLDGLRNSEITLYLGHSRDGGGPDFDPPKLKNGHTDYDWYHANPKDKKEMNKVLAEDPNKARILGLFSCSSIRWFSKGVASQAPGSGLIGTTDTFYVRNFEQVFPFLEKIFSYQCIDQLLVDDVKKHAKAKVHNKWKVPEQDKAISKLTLTQQTLEKLATQLSSKDIEVRKEVFREIQSFDKKYYTAKVWRAVNDYKFAVSIGKNFK